MKLTYSGTPCTSTCFPTNVPVAAYQIVAKAPKQGLHRSFYFYANLGELKVLFHSCQMHAEALSAWQAVTLSDLCLPLIPS